MTQHKTMSDELVVKPLEWREPKDDGDDFGHENDFLVADGIGGKYSIQQEADHVLLWWAWDGFVWERCENIDEAKAKAEADWQQRVRSIVTWNTRAAPPASDALVERVARALYDCEKERSDRCDAIISAAKGKTVTVGMEPWEECWQAFYHDARAAIAAMPDVERMRGPQSGVNCPDCGCRLPIDYLFACPDCGAESVADSILKALGEQQP